MTNGAPSTRSLLSILGVLPAIEIDRTYQKPVHTCSALIGTKFVPCSSGFSVSSVPSIIVSSANGAPAYTAVQQSSANTPTKQSAALRACSQLWELIELIKYLCTHTVHQIEHNLFFALQASRCHPYHRLSFHRPPVHRHIQRPNSRVQLHQRSSLQRRQMLRSPRKLKLQR